MTVLDMNPSTLPAEARALYEKMAARRKAHGEGFGGPYLALLNHPELARRIEELGFFLKFEGALPRTVYQFIVLTVARATGAGFEWHDHIEHARAAGLPAEVIDCIGSARVDALAQPYALVHAILAKTMAGRRSRTTSRRRPSRNGAGADWSRSWCSRVSIRCSRRSIRDSASGRRGVEPRHAHIIVVPARGTPRRPRRGDPVRGPIFSETWLWVPRCAGTTARN